MGIVNVILSPHDAVSGSIGRDGRRGPVAKDDTAGQHTGGADARRGHCESAQGVAVAAVVDILLGSSRPVSWGLLSAAVGQSHLRDLSAGMSQIGRAHV